MFDADHIFDRLTGRVPAALGLPTGADLAAAARTFAPPGPFAGGMPEWAIRQLWDQVAEMRDLADFAMSNLRPLLSDPMAR